MFDENESELYNEINRATKMFVEDNITYPTKEDYVVIMNVIMIGSSIAFSHILHANSRKLS